MRTNICLHCKDWLLGVICSDTYRWVKWSQARFIVNKKLLTNQNQGLELTVL